jgi:uncharacterized protein YprB with RNaseH-like and TPR domain
VNLKRRLERLAGAVPPAAAAVTQMASPAAAADGDAASAKQRTLEELRRQMRVLLDRDGARAMQAPPPSPRVGVESLPFVARQTPSGPLWQRRECLGPAERVGRAALAATARAEPAVLADLALDPAVASSDAGSWLFLDTETTGLGGAGTLVFLVGMAAIEPSGEIAVEQLLLVEPGAEQPLLERVAERVAAASLIISFNGKAFDRPMLEGRAVLNRLPGLAPRPHLDLLHVGRRLHRQRLGCCTLKRLELDVLGFDRGDDIDGSEVGPIYSHFLRTADAAGLSAVVTHNYWDVLSMVGLVGLYGQRTPELAGQDLAGLARTLKRAGAVHHAERVADMACASGGGVEAYRVRAELAKSRGDSSSAVQDFERLCQEADDPRGRLELAKLYEHKLRQPAHALRWLELGTNENFMEQEKRRERLERKLRRPRPI